MNDQVLSIWEEMNRGVSNVTVKPMSNRPALTMNKTSSEKSSNWITYLGLASHQETPQVENGDSSVVAMWKEMNKNVPCKRLKSLADKTSLPDNASVSQKSDNWKMYLGTDQKKTGSFVPLPQKEHSIMHNGTSDETKRLAAAALSAVKDAAAIALGKGKVEISEVRDFAGQEIEYKKLVDADSKEASERGKAPASAVDAILEQIKKKPKLSVLDKTKKDWGEYKDENKGLENELDAYKKSSNQYLDKVSFLERTDYREFERERDARLALQARRRPDMRED